MSELDSGGQRCHYIQAMERQCLFFFVCVHVCMCVCVLFSVWVLFLLLLLLLFFGGRGYGEWFLRCSMVPFGSWGYGYGSTCGGNMRESSGLLKKCRVLVFRVCYVFVVEAS